MQIWLLILLCQEQLPIQDLYTPPLIHTENLCLALLNHRKQRDYTQNSRCRTSVPVIINVQIWLVHLSGHEELSIEHVNPSVNHIENATLCLENP